MIQSSGNNKFPVSKYLLSKYLLSIEASCALDLEAQTQWGFNPFALIEAAGRACAKRFLNSCPELFSGRPRVTVAAGSGNNAADAMVMLRYYILCGLLDSSASALVLNRLPQSGDTSPHAGLVKSLEKMGIPVLVWEDVNTAGKAESIFANSDIIIDGIAGTGISGPLRGTLLEMVKAVNSPGFSSPFPIPHSPLPAKPLIVSVDLPSGNSEQWEPGMPIVKADLTLAIEPQKYCNYTPAARPFAGKILSVGGIFPPQLIARYSGVEFLDWENSREKITKIRADAYKNERGSVEIWAGNTGTSGAALIAARGAQAAGAGLVRLVADETIYPILASQVAGIMVAKSGVFEDASFKADTILLGPGWGKTKDRLLVLDRALLLEKAGTPLILDADAIELAQDRVFNGNVILTPHPGEFSKFTGINRKELLYRPAPILLKYSRERNAVIILKGHVITIAAPDGRLGVVDGMLPGLAAGGTGDLLAGFCAAITARMHRQANFDVFNCAAIAASLLIETGKSGELKSRFTDPLELADKAADLAGKAWL